MYSKNRRRWLFGLFAALAVVVLVTSFGPTHVWSNAAHALRTSQAGASTRTPRGPADFDIREDKSGQEKLETRRTNIVLKSPYSHIDTIRYSLPEGIYPEFMPQPAKLTSRFGEYEATFTLDQDNLIYIRKLKMNKGEFPAESYNELVEFYRNVNKADNTKMVFLSKT